MKMLQVMLLPFLISFSCNGYCWGHKEWLVTCTKITPCHARVLIYKYFNPPLSKMMKTLPHKTISCDATKKKSLSTNKLLHQSTLRTNTVSCSYQSQGIFWCKGYLPIWIGFLQLLQIFLSVFVYFCIPGFSIWNCLIKSGVNTPIMLSLLSDMYPTYVIKWLVDQYATTEMLLLWVCKIVTFKVSYPIRYMRTIKAYTRMRHKRILVNHKDEKIISWTYKLVSSEGM